MRDAGDIRTHADRFPLENMNNDAKDDYGIQRKSSHYPYVDKFLDDDVSHI